MKTAFKIILVLFALNSLAVSAKNTNAVIHVWEMQEIVLFAEQPHNNYYTEVTCWIELQGPGFSKKVYGFWDGDNKFVVRIVAPRPGEWKWLSGSNQPSDAGLNNKSGQFEAIAWTDAEKKENPNRRGFIRPVPNGHALQYADGTPFFMIGDTWLAGSTWRLPYRGNLPSAGYKPGPGIGFEDAVIYRKAQGFNSISMIASFPGWEADSNANTYANADGIYIRNAWEKFDYLVREGKMTSKNMRDEYGNLPFKLSNRQPGVADFDQIVPEYFQSLDQKVAFLATSGFVPLIETVRRDVCPAWKAYTSDFNASYARYVQYLISRYGAYSIFFSGIHLDWIPKQYSLTADEFNEALTYHLQKYGPLPFEQPHTTLINNSTYLQFGHGADCPWLTMHSVGNKPRDHRVTGALDTLFHLQPHYPAINFEPYYTGWNHEINMPNGERPAANTERDNYFSRAQMYGSVLSGGLSGHVHGTAAYDITSTGEPDGMRPHFWDALLYESAEYMAHLRDFILSEGSAFQNLEICHADVHPRKAMDAPEKGLDGWSYMMRTADKSLAMLYFELKCAIPQLTGFMPSTTYTLQWYDTLTGTWKEPFTLTTDKKGKMTLSAFPGGNSINDKDWALKIKKQ